MLYDVVGTATAVSFFSIVSPDLTRSAALSGQTWTGSYLVQRVSGAAPGNAQTGVRIDVRGETAPNSETEATFGEPVAPATETLRTISRTLDNAATNQVRANLAIRVENGDTVDFRVKIKALQFEQGGVRSVYQAALSEFDISEAGQRSVYYLKPDGIDDWMSFATPFAPNGPFTLAAIVNGGTGFPAPMCFGSAGGLSSYNLAHGAGVRMDGNANSVVFDPANDPAWQALEGTRRVDVARINGAASAESWRNGQEYAGTPTVLGDILAVAGFDTLFRSGGSYGSTRFYGGALIPAAITEPQRLLLQTYLASKGGISL
ncbi:hypothetical protein [Roseicitreum antarcticum]|uniref:hypothetical protein n=2 Tax=Roseicitreum antarcticum TaxID=564137 RepID=UPI0016813A33|nr:hypothetical protein [Roseicitreum antarcticum]